jgi:murein DD-endopeptidase MepM/ murein hydrolase activator NlpD
MRQRLSFLLLYGGLLSAAVATPVVAQPRRILEDLLRPRTSAPARSVPQDAASGGAIVLEGERLASGATASEGNAGVQPMSAFGRSWSGDAQLFWSPTQPGEQLVLNLPAPADGSYRLTASFTKAPDYGDVAILVNQQQLGGVFGGYNPQVIHSGPVPFGIVNLRRGPNQLVLRVIGKFARSRGFFVGLDRLELVPLETATPDRPEAPRPGTEDESFQPRPSTPARTGTVAPSPRAPVDGLLSSVVAFEQDLARFPTGAGWVRYLELDAVQRSAASPASRRSSADAQQLSAALTKLEKLAADPSYTSLTARPTFTGLLTSLRDDMRVSARPITPVLPSGEPTALALQWGGQADTQVDFNTFFNADHTLVARFMPQYPWAYRQPLFAVDGTGNFWIGLMDVGSMTKQPPRIELLIGSARQTYGFNPIDAGKWYHLAVVRTGNQFQAYMDGWPLLPPLDINPADPLLPQGRLRLGRLAPVTAAPDPSNAQFFGLLDDVAVFNKALTANEAFALKTGQPGPTLTGGEPGLLVGWNFDRTLGYGALTAATGSLTPTQQAVPVPVSADRDNEADSQQLPLPYQQSVHDLPFLRGEAWKVIQGVAHPNGSHTGYAAFCWDLVREGTTLYAPLYATTDGTVVELERSHPAGAVDSNGRSLGNVVLFEVAPGEVGGYVHLQEQTLSPKISLGSRVAAGQFVALAGNTGLGADRTGLGDIHLHLGFSNREPDPFVTIPMALRNYEVADSPDGPWSFVAMGVPRPGQWVRRPPVAADLAAVAVAADYAKLANPGPNNLFDIDFSREVVTGTVRNVGRNAFSGNRLVMLEAYDLGRPQPQVVATRQVSSLGEGATVTLEGTVDAPKSIRLYLLSISSGDDDPGNDEYYWRPYSAPQAPPR